MRETFLPFSRPDITDAEVDAVVATLRSGWIAGGPRVAELESRFAAWVGAGGAVALSSATAGFHLVFEALGLGAGDEVIVPSLTWPSPVNMVCKVGARPVFADIDRATFQLDPDDVERKITPRTRAVVALHFGGQACDLGRLEPLCREHGLHLVEDAAHAVGTEYDGARIGSRGHTAVFSLHAIKNLTAGEGGLVTSNDEALIEALRRGRFHGVERDAWRRYGGADVAATGPDYDIVEPGWKYTLTDIQAALALAQLGRIDAMNARRAELAAVYDGLLDAVPELERPRPVSYPARHAWHLYPVLVDARRAGLDRDAFRAELRRRNVGTGLHFLAVHELDSYRRHAPTTLPSTETVAERIVSLPLFPGMSEDDARSVVEAARDTIARARETE